MRTLQTQEMEKLQQLNRIKVLATLVLVACFCAMVIAKALEHHYPPFAIIAAFAEAATIGGIADWYAVVALFKKPLNLPFPHTAIIPNNQHRIAENLGGFIDSNFLARGPVSEKLNEIDFAGEMSNWLSSRERSHGLSKFVARLIPQLLNSVDEKGLVQFATNRVSGQLAKTDISPLIGKLMQTFTKDGRHLKLMDDLISALHTFLNDEETLELVRTKVKRELPVLFNVVGGDTLVVRRIVRIATELLDEVREQEDHPLRGEFEAFLTSYVKRVRRTKRFSKQIENLKQVVLGRPELEDAADHMWHGLKEYILADVQADDSVLVERLTDMLVEVGVNLKQEPALRNDINTGMVLVISNVVEDQRGNIAAYVSEQVKSWDMQQLLTLIEANVGRDLQFIRFNGMIIGGCVGLVLFALETVLLSS
ncbi:DUF445 domain-containing protein [Sulfitobacter aestuariivivens]|nr:DUF445 family protein [Sulfitobacter aestuariivivens]